MMVLWTVYENPKDYPGKFVARKFVGDQPTPTAIVGDSFEAVSKSLAAAGLYFLARDPNDDACIVGTWL